MHGQEKERPRNLLLIPFYMVINMIPNGAFTACSNLSIFSK